jgi:hypothetical protein
MWTWMSADRASADVQAAVAETITAPSAGRHDSPRRPWRRWVVYVPLAALALFLLLVAVLYHWLQPGRTGCPWLSRIPFPRTHSTGRRRPLPSKPALPSPDQPLQPACRQAPSCRTAALASPADPDGARRPQPSPRTRRRPPPAALPAAAGKPAPARCPRLPVTIRPCRRRCSHPLRVPEKRRRDRQT